MDFRLLNSSFCVGEGCKLGCSWACFCRRNHNDSPTVSLSFFKCLTDHSWVKLSYLDYRYQVHPGLQWWSRLTSLLGHLAVTANSTYASLFTFSPQNDFCNLAISVNIQRISHSTIANPYRVHILSARCYVGRVRTKVRKMIGHQDIWKGKDIPCSGEADGLLSRWCESWNDRSNN